MAVVEARGDDLDVDATSARRTAALQARGRGEHQRQRLNRAGNRTMNHAQHIVAITQIRRDTPGCVVYRRKLADGTSHKEALRCMKRRISDAVWRQLQTNRSGDQTHDTNWLRRPLSRGNLVAYRSTETLRANGRPKPFIREGLTSRVGFGATSHGSISTG